ncbi:MAG: hypothetical protein FWG31_04635 [Oscillospiraceae bacterium]|nr:hypothetical protein [Oscillospiraceae bacterium]
MTKEFVIDPRDTADVREKIKELSQSYTPEWNFDPSNPDAGAVIGLIYAHQTGGTIRRLNQTFAKYQTEFVNMLSLPLKPAHPARGAVVVELTRDTIPGMDLPKGTRFLGGREDEQFSLVFETASDIHVTNSRLRDILAVSPSRGKIINLLGSAREPSLFDNDAGVTAESPAEGEFPAFDLFDFDGEGIGRNALLLFHKHIFDVSGDAKITVRVTAPDGTGLSEMLSDPNQYRWSYLSEDGLKPFASVSARDGVLTLTRDADFAKTEEDKELYSVILLETAGSVTETREFGSVALSSACDETAPDFILRNTTELPPDAFMPFGETASLFDECYWGNDALFNQAGALVTARFDVRCHDRLETFTPQQQADNLKVIKRKPRNTVFETAATKVNRVNLEYFNGLGWRILPLKSDMGEMFAKAAGRVEFSFICPEDWKPLTVGGHTGRCIRIRIEQADNCYLRPCVHTMPEVSGLTFSYRYEESWMPPQKMIRVSGTSREELRVADGTSFAAFTPLRHPKDALYFGFDRKMSGGPVSLLFKIEPVRRTSEAALTVEYSTPAGFTPLKVIDRTESLTTTGTLAFLPPADFAEREVEGVRRFWLRVSDEQDSLRVKPRIEEIFINAAEVCNVETMPEESFYIDTAQPNMSFPLAARNILSADVYVNEMGMHSANALKQIAAEREVRSTCNFLGDVSELFVKWTEVGDFSHSGPGDRHYRIDRMTNTIHFGDGITVMAPRSQTNESFTVQARCTRGLAGNLPAGAINAAQGRLLYIGGINNPIDTWGGSDIESAEKAHRRGANVLSSQNRLVSAADFEREILGYSSSIRKVRCVTGQTADGRLSDGAVTAAVMTKDYRGGSHAFAELKDALKRMILEKCEAGLRENLITVTEPVYVSVSIAVFVETSLKSFAVKNQILSHLEAFLDPLPERNGWRIGRLPSEAQIRFELGSGVIPGVVRGFTATARWQEGVKIRECALDSLKPGPLMIAVSGGHTVHITEG